MPHGHDGLVPFALNPDGAYTLGLKIGRKSYDLILMNFTGEIVRSYSVAYLYPTPEKLKAFLTDALTSLHAETTADVLAKLIGFGVAMPDELWNWSDEMGAPEAEMERWKTFDVAAAVKALIDTPIHTMNDASAACVAELVFGRHPRHSDFQYFYVGPFIGGGLVLNGTIFTGSRSNAGAVGSMLTFDDNTSLANPRQLLSVASTITLQLALERANKNFEILWEADGLWEGIDEFLGPWIDQVASHLAVAAVNAVSLLDVPRVIIDGSVPVNVRDAIVARTADIVRTLPTAGLLPFETVCGSLGFAARAIGAASLPLHATFSYDPDALLKAEVSVL